MNFGNRLKSLKSMNRRRYTRNVTSYKIAIKENKKRKATEVVELLPHWV